MDYIGREPIVSWDKKVPNTELEKFQHIIEKKHSIKFETYWDLHKWTVQNYTTFLEEMWDFFGIISSEPYKEVLVKTGPGFLDNEWFSGAKLNYAENVLRVRDGRIALICLDEFGNEERVTFAEMYEEVKLYAATFRKNGLKPMDRVACFMSNRKESLFAFFASASIGAVWGGPVPYYGAKAASNVISMMDPKFLITVDSHQDNGITFPILDYLPEIAKNAPTLEKVILVVTQKDTRKKDLSNIRNCVILEDFLEAGRSPDGKVPDIVFEQLSFNHPLTVNFTSGTTGLPKAAVHSIGTILTLLRDSAFTYDLKSGDVFGIQFPVGWTIWDNFIQCLALGVTLFMYCGSVYYTVNGNNFWDLLAKYNCKFVSLVTSMADKMEKMNMAPSSGTDMSCLKIIEIGASPVKKHNFDYLLNKISKNAFVGVRYGATEMYGFFAGFNMNMPAYVGELQVPTLGVDLQCFDESGKSVVGKRGETVVCSPAINFPIYLWKDNDNRKLNSLYLMKFPGVWAQHDECWINPKTKGIVVIGRSDDTLKQKGERFGAADIYFAIHTMEELQDYICVNQTKYNGDCRAVLFVKMRQGYKLTPGMRKKVEAKVDDELFADFVPELVLEVPDIPYNLNNKRMESLVRKIIAKNEIPEVMNIRNPDCLKHFLDIPEYNLNNKRMESLVRKIIAKNEIPEVMNIRNPDCLKHFLDIPEVLSYNMQ